MKALITSHFQWVKNFYAKYERWMMSATLVAGFLFDFIAFVNIDLVFKFTILVIYWVSAGVAIAFMQFYDAKQSRFREVPGEIPRTSVAARYARLFMPLVVQWTFGGLLNISLIFYWFSGAFSVSWPLLVITVLLLLSNEAFRHQFLKPLVQISVYFFTTFSLFSLVLPFWFASVSPWLFVVAGVASVIIFTLYILGLSVLTKRPLVQSRPLFISMGIITIVMNILYFTNVIPPIPLALREAGLYHSLDVLNGKYILSGEPENVWQNFLDGVFGQTVHVAPGEKIYLYTAIFAPDNLTTTIVDHWQYYNQKQKAWVNEGDLSFVINGGRKEGYKGYSWQSNLAAGQWRVYVQNQRGQTLAQVRFMVERVDVPVLLQEVEK